MGRLGFVGRGRGSAAGRHAGLSARERRCVRGRAHHPASPITPNSGGSVTWSGSLLGVDLSSGGAFAPVAGQAALAVDLATLDGQATFDQLRVSTPDAAVPFRRPSLSYAIAVEGNAFADTAGRVQGGFYGPAHEEMAGTLNDRTAGVELLAGFGGRR